MDDPISRRTAVKRLAAGAAAVTAAAGLPGQTAVAATSARTPLKGAVQQSVCRWCYAQIPLDQLCEAGRAMGLVGIDLLHPEDFDTVKRHDLVCTMVSNPTVDGLGGIPRGWNRVEHHDKLVQAYEVRIRQTADAGYERLICFSGNRAGLDDAEGLTNCALGLQRIIPTAQQYNVTLCMELLNSKRTHKDYQCDHTAWGVELVKRVGSGHFKLLYDIFHMQIMEGDVCDTIRENHDYFGHYHTGGVPGRGEIDDSQELPYPRIMRAILDTGYTGYVAQEFVPKGPDPLAALRQGVQVCDV